MRLFRSAEAAVKAGVLFCDVDDVSISILTDREERLLKALEKLLPTAKDNALTFAWDDNSDDLRQHIADIEAAEALIRELAVEG